MSKLIRRTVASKKRGTALIVALQLTALTLLSLVSFVGGPQQQQPPDAPAGSQSSALVGKTLTVSGNSMVHYDLRLPDVWSVYGP
jgi:hypothetical protein